MSQRDKAADRLQQRLALLAEIDDLGAGRLPTALASQVGDLRHRAAERLGHGSEFTVVALAGATGSGKSSTFNALAGREVAQVGVRRPTTSVAQALVFVDNPSSDPAGALLDWLNVPARQVVVDPALAGLILLDLPDHDSIEAAHRAEVDRLSQVVDVFCWIVDPQKYADAALHQGYLRALANHAGVTVVVMNQIDRLDPSHREAALADLRRLLREGGMDDGTNGVRVLAASAATGEGHDALRREMAARVHEHRAVVARLDADLDWLGQQLRAGIGEVRAGTVSAGVRDRMVDSLCAAAGVDAVVTAVAAHHRRASTQVAGWPPTRWVSRLRPDPLRRLGLGRGRPGSERITGPAVVPRTGLGSPSPMATAQVDSAVRTVVDQLGAGLPVAWQQRLADVAAAGRGDLTDALDRAVATTHLPDDQPRWWRFAGLLQTLATAAMVLGLLWLLVIGVVAWFQLPDLPAVKVGAVPLPTLLAVAGAGLGLVVAGVAMDLWGVGRVAAGAPGGRCAPPWPGWPTIRSSLRSTGNCNPSPVWPSGSSASPAADRQLVYAGTAGSGTGDDQLTITLRRSNGPV